MSHSEHDHYLARRVRVAANDASCSVALVPPGEVRTTVDALARATVDLVELVESYAADVPDPTYHECDVTWQEHRDVVRGLTDLKDAVAKLTARLDALDGGGTDG